MFRLRPMAMFGSSSAPEDPRGPTRDWLVGCRALMIDVWDGETYSAEISTSLLMLTAWELERMICLEGCEVIDSRKGAPVRETNTLLYVLAAPKAALSLRRSLSARTRLRD